MAAIRRTVLGLFVVAGVFLMAGCADDEPPGTAAAQDSVPVPVPTDVSTSVVSSPTTGPGEVDRLTAPPTTPVTTPPTTRAAGAPASSAPPASTTTTAVQGTIRQPDSGASAASALSATTRCGPDGSRTAFADLSWSPAGRRGSEQVVQLTTFQNGFGDGRYDASPSLPPGAASFTWPNVNPNGIHTWRVLTRQGTDWVASEVHRFTGPVCVSDPLGTS